MRETIASLVRVNNASLTSEQFYDKELASLLSVYLGSVFASVYKRTLFSDVDDNDFYKYNIIVYQQIYLEPFNKVDLTLE